VLSQLKILNWHFTTIEPHGYRLYVRIQEPNITSRNNDNNIMVRTVYNNLTVTTDITQFNRGYLELYGLKPVYDEYILNIDTNGKVNITKVDPPTLCNITAHII
jgi:hypothetical protein